jgi:BON domain
MKAKALLSLVVLAVLVLALGTACNKASQGTRSDAQVAGDVQSKIFTDPNVQSRQISVQSANGVVTLSGYVNSEAERAAAAGAAAQVDGVKTVVNNLQTQQAQAQPPAAEQQAPAEEAKSQPATETRPATKPAMREHRPSARSSRNGSGSESTSASNKSGSSTSGSDTSLMSSNSTPAAPAPPPAPAAPKKVTVPAGTNLSIRMVDSLDSERNQVGDQFRATLNAPVVVDDEVVIPQDADIQGRVVDVKSAGRYAGASNLTLELTSLSYNGKTYNLSTNQWTRAAHGRGKSTAGKIGGGAALGAIIGGLAGGGKGAAIGATVGAGAGTGVATVGKGNQITLNSEALLSFNLQAPLTVTASANAGRNRQPMNQ